MHGTQLPVFTCSWKLLCLCDLRERDGELLVQRYFKLYRTERNMHVAPFYSCRFCLKSDVNVTFPGQSGLFSTIIFCGC